MSYEEFRRRIDTARQILVGAVPSPAGQIDQITYALIYKFMNDIDDKSASLGGKRSYFTGDYEKYNWNNLMSPSLGAHERLELYRQAVQTMAKNPNLPPMFAEIYQNAFLPFNSANVLTLFLKEIDKFSHGESDDIGDAYEYLLSITGAQGDVGQFRTPRHIIEFVVNAVNPGKDDCVLDPACGTAGFLIKAYEHVMAQHDGKDKHGTTNDEKRLTASELEKIHHNYHGFDIDPTMVRTAKVNMYLHGFTSPDIVNHDSLTSEEYWEKRYDVILANPPFMTPKGGIQPHKKFSVTANRAEVLFVDYIMSHINPVSGRAGIIVPEGIIFQSGKAYKQLRKNLIENSLYTVVSLPSGVFNPYAGVKTSILLLDKELAKQRNEILFVKVENDGYSLGAQRRPIAGNQFPEALQAIEQFMAGEELTSDLAHAVKKSEIAESGDYNLSGDRYKVAEINTSQDYPIVALNDIAEVRKGSAITKSQINPDGPIPVVAGGQRPAYYHDESNRDPDVITISASGAYAGFVNYWTMPIFASDCSTVQTKDSSVALNRYLYETLKYLQDDIYKLQTGGGQPHVYPKDIQKIKIPLPPLEIQRQIVDELDGYQRIIDAATKIVKTYKPTIKINPDWESVKISDMFDKVTESWTPTASNAADFHFYVGLENIESGTGSMILDNNPYKSLPSSNKTWFKSGDILFGRLRPNLNKVAYSSIGPSICSTDILVLRAKDTSRTNSKLYSILMRDENFNSRVLAGIAGAQLPRVKTDYFFNLELPDIPFEEQKQIVADLEAEQKLIDANKKLITLYQQKIKSVVAEVWGE